VSARQSYLDFLVHHLTSESLSFGFTDAQAKLAYDVTPQQHVTLTLIGGRSRFENDPDLNTANDIAVGLNRSLVAVGAWRWTSGTRTVTQRVLGAANRFRNENPSSADLDRGGERQFGYRADAAAALTSTLLAEAGASVGRNTADSTRLTPIAGIPRAFDDYSGSATEAGAYADVKWTTRRSVVVAPGIRVDRSTLASQFAASPWLQLEAPAGAGRIRASAGVYTQFAGFNEVLSFDGAPDLDPERARQYDAGYERRIGTTSRVSVTAYRRDTPNAIRRAGYEPRVVGNRVVNGNITAAYQNRVSSASRGVEFVFERRVSHGLSGWASYSYSRTRDTDTRTGESFWGDADQRHTFNAYGALRRSERASFVAKLRIGSNFPITGYIAKTAAGYVVTDQRNTARLPVYARLDLRANRTFSVGAHRLTLFAEVLNVLNRDNVRYQPPFINFFTRRAAQPFDTMLPIVPSAGVLIEF
jgi:outer membrane cobalamin receptor